jgi:hypothetical protein
MAHIDTGTVFYFFVTKEEHSTSMSILNLTLLPCWSVLEFWKFLVWKIKFDELDFFFRPGFLQATQAVKNQFKLDKKSSNLIFQTRNFKIQVQINRRSIQCSTEDRKSLPFKYRRIFGLPNGWREFVHRTPWALIPTYLLPVI